jgi:apolipoprotein N-acyltransferase
MAGAIAIIMGLSFLMSFSFWLAHVIRLQAGTLTGYISAVAFWLASEFLSLNVNLVSPWLNLGNGLAEKIAFIQWYEFTGTSGGSLWILLSNILLALFIIGILNGKKKTIFLAFWIIILVVPSAYSLYRYHYLTESTSASEEIVIVQPLIDPYTEKFVIPFEAQLDKAIALASSAAEKSVSWIIMPETTVDDPVNLDDLNSDRYINKIRGLTDSFPETSIVAGLVSYKLYPPSEKAPTISARKIDSTGFFYDHFNTAFKIDRGKEIEVYHKSKLVPGIEMQFANGPGRLIAEILPQLGGTKWGYGVQDTRTTFINNRTGTKIAPIICYESVFGEYITGYVRNGANALFIITNDGWWKNTNGYDQHLSYASLRAIETRRPVRKISKHRSIVYY